MCNQSRLGVIGRSATTDMKQTTPVVVLQLVLVVVVVLQLVLVVVVVVVVVVLQLHCGSKKTRQLRRTITATQFSRF